MAPLAIELTKLSGGGALLKCIRCDGSVTWQRNEGVRGRFFAFHDLRHYAAECLLGYEQAFYGLVASGWEIADTTGKSAKGRLPDEAIMAEHLVGMLDADSTNGRASSAADFNQYAAAFAAQNNRSMPAPLSEQSLERIRSMASELHSKWIALPEEATMRLTFPSKA